MLVPVVGVWPETLHRAIRHSVFAGGKRLRPILCLAAGETAGAPPGRLLAPACGLEMIHAYSLIHDDLPALDNDDLRRGVPTCHVKFGEATAILAGDALLTHGLGTLARYPEGGEFAAAKIRVLETVVEAAWADAVRWMQWSLAAASSVRVRLSSILRTAIRTVLNSRVSSIG